MYVLNHYKFAQYKHFFLLFLFNVFWQNDLYPFKRKNPPLFSYIANNYSYIIVYLHSQVSGRNALIKKMGKKVCYIFDYKEDFLVLVLVCFLMMIIFVCEYFLPSTPLFRSECHFPVFSYHEDRVPAYFCTLAPIFISLHYSQVSLLSWGQLAMLLVLSWKHLMS